jgi:Sugar (and other) transporter
VLVPVLGYLACFAFGLGSGVWLCVAELFPVRIRGRAMSVAPMVLWLSVSLVAAMFLTLIRFSSASGVYLGSALVCGGSFLYIYLQLPETKKSHARTDSIPVDEGENLIVDVRAFTDRRWPL